MNSFKAADVLIIDDFHSGFMDALEKQGITYIYKPGFDPDKDMQMLSESDIIAVRSKIRFTEKVLRDHSNIKCIARGGAGMDNIDESFAREQGITLLNAPEGNRDAVAEHTIGLLLGMSKQLFKGVSEVKNHVWQREPNRGWEIGGKTIGIVGFGNTGMALASKLSGFRCKVLTYDKYVQTPSIYAEHVSLDKLLSESDVISFHVPLTNETRHMLNDELISEMKDDVVLINVSRGAVCSNAAILKGIKSGKVKSFAGDVLENENINELSAEEKPIFEELISDNQIFITPHVAGWSHESYERIARVLSDKIIEYTTKVKNI